MRACVPLFALFLTTVAARPASADHPERYLQPRPQQTASTEIREMSSMVSRGVIWRALIGVEETRPYLVIEVIRRGRTEGDPDRIVRQYRFDEVALYRRMVRTAHLTRLGDLRWRRGRLELTASGRQGDLSCTLALRRPISAPRCVPIGTNGGGPVTGPTEPSPVPPPPPPPPRWSSDPEVIRACGVAFSGGADQAACRAAVSSARQNPVPLIRACEGAMDGDASELACVRAVVASPGDALGAITRCEAAMDGDASELACIGVLAGERRAGIIADACEAAMDGDPNELRCMRAATRIPGDVARTIAACEEAAAGDDAELECINAAYGRAR